MAVGKVIIIFEDDRRDMAIEVTWIVAVGLYSWFSWEMQFMSPVPRSIESLESGLPEPNSKGMRAFLAATGQNWTAAGTCAVLRLNLVQSIRKKWEWIFLRWYTFLIPVPVAARGLRRSFAAACLPRLWVRIPPAAWMFVCYECCVLSGRCLCSKLITRREESYGLWCVVVFDLETSWMRRPWPTGGSCAKNKQTLFL